MGRYAVLGPCVVGDLHYAQVPAEPIEADDTLAAALVAAGVLAPVDAGADEVDPQDEHPARSRRRPATKD